MNQPAVYLSCDENYRWPAQNLSLRHGFEFADSSDIARRANAGDIWLHKSAKGLELQIFPLQGKLPLTLDFNRPRFVVHGQAQMPIIKAVGKGCRTVCDASAGWCQDALTLCQAGIRVTAYEQQPVIFSMLEDALERNKREQLSLDQHNADQQSIEQNHNSEGHTATAQEADELNLEIRLACSCEEFERLAMFGKKPWDCVYLDPMYPKRNKSAAVKKSAQLLQALAQPPSSEFSLRWLELARKVALRRVVVKRPHSAAPISPGRSGAVESKLVRYDLYSAFPNVANSLMADA